MGFAKESMPDNAWPQCDEIGSHGIDARTLDGPFGCPSCRCKHARCSNLLNRCPVPKGPFVVIAERLLLQRSLAGTAALTVLFWDTHREQVLSFATGVFLGIGLAFHRGDGAAGNVGFAATLAELRRHREALGTRSESAAD
jgi:hypothetical protein